MVSRLKYARNRNETPLMVLTENYSPVLYPIHGLASCITFVYITFHRDIYRHARSAFHTGFLSVIR